jgi:hypothetical protein
MLHIYRYGLSEKVLKEFPGLGHTSGKGWTWEGRPSVYVKHATRGTRQVVKGEIEGKWDPVIDPGPQKTKVVPVEKPTVKVVENKPVMENRPKQTSPLKVTCVTCTGDRPVCLGLLEKWMSQQTHQPYQWLVIDDGNNPHSPSLSCDYIRRMPRKSDPKWTLNLNMEVALNNVLGDVVLFWEDDEYYAERYIESFVSKFQEKGCMAVGLARSKYYHLPSRTYHVHPNAEHASLAQSAIHKDFIDPLKSVLDGSPFIDVRLWEYIRQKEEKRGSWRAPFPKEGVSLNGGTGFLFDDGLKNCLYVGMKGMPGRGGIGSGHKGIGKSDSDFSVLSSWIGRKSDFDSYIALNLSSPTINVKPLVSKLEAKRDRFNLKRGTRIRRKVNELR